MSWGWITLHIDKLEPCLLHIDITIASIGSNTMDIFGFTLTDIYVAIMIAIAALLIGLFVTWLVHEDDYQSTDKRKPRRK